jgi:hypothetical protein
MPDTTTSGRIAPYGMSPNQAEILAYITRRCDQEKAKVVPNTRIVERLGAEIRRLKGGY